MDHRFYVYFVRMVYCAADMHAKLILFLIFFFSFSLLLLFPLRRSIVAAAAAAAHCIRIATALVDVAIQATHKCLLRTLIVHRDISFSSSVCAENDF